MEMGLGSKSETNLISEMLTKVRNWAAAHDVAVFFVAHPSKLYRQNDGELSGSQGIRHFILSKLVCKGGCRFDGSPEL